MNRELTIKEQAMIDEIMDEFEFEKVKKVMDCLKWKWCKSEGENYYFEVPSLREIKRRGRSLLKDAILKIGKNEKDFYINIGGFVVEINRYDDDEELIISLAFEIEKIYIDEKDLNPE